LLSPAFRRYHFSPPGASTSATTWEIPAAEVGTVGAQNQELGNNFFCVDYELFITSFITFLISVAWKKKAQHKAEALTSQQLHFRHITQMNILRCAFLFVLTGNTLSGGPDTVGSVLSSFHLKTD